MNTQRKYHITAACLLVSLLLPAGRAVLAATTQYEYDSKGRLVLAERDSGPSFESITTISAIVRAPRFTGTAMKSGWSMALQAR